MSQQRLGDELGISFQQIQKYESGANRVSASRLYALSMLFGLPLEAFFSDLKRPEDGGLSRNLPSETYEAALTITALGERLDLPTTVLCEKLGELAISLMR